MTMTKQWPLRKLTEPYSRRTNTGLLHDLAIKRGGRTKTWKLNHLEYLPHLDIHPPHILENIRRSNTCNLSISNNALQNLMDLFDHYWQSPIIWNKHDQRQLHHPSLPYVNKITMFTYVHYTKKLLDCQFQAQETLTMR